jgi:hypothetical protein
VYRADGFNRRELDDDHVLDQTIDAVASVDPQPIVFDRRRQLANGSEVASVELIGETGLRRPIPGDPDPAVSALASRSR